MKTKSIKVGTILASALFVMACDASSDSDEKELSENKSKLTEMKITKSDVKKTDVQKEELMWKTGTVHYFDFEGGFVGIVTDKGEKLLPMGLKAEYRQVGAILKIKGKLVTDMMTIQQWGTPFKITNIKLQKVK